MPVRPAFRFLVPLIVACALFMENLDSTVIATALPQIAASLGEDPLRLNLAITSYLLSLAVFIPLSGWVADRYGARRVFRAAIVIFTVGSACCGLSNSLPELVAARSGWAASPGLTAPPFAAGTVRQFFPGDVAPCDSFASSEECTCW
jgi:MFS family permease